MKSCTHIYANIKYKRSVYCQHTCSLRLRQAELLIPPVRISDINK